MSDKPKSSIIGTIFKSIVYIILSLVILGGVWYILNKEEAKKMLQKWNEQVNQSIGQEIKKDDELSKVEARIVELQKKQGIFPESNGEEKDTRVDINKKNEILFYADINFNDPEPFRLIPGEELIVFERKLDNNNLPGSEKDLWYYQSIQFQGEINYQIKVIIGERDEDYQIVPKSDYSETGIPNMIDWLSFNLPEAEKDIVNTDTRRKIIFRIERRFDDISGTGIQDVPAILYTGLNYQPESTDTASVNYRLPLKQYRKVEICRVESKYKRLPTGEYEYNENEDIKLKAYQKKVWKYKSMKIEPNSKVKLIIEEEDPVLFENNEIGYNKTSIDYTIKYNIANLISWLETKNQETVKYNPYEPLFNERIYYIELQ